MKESDSRCFWCLACNRFGFETLLSPTAITHNWPVKLALLGVVHDHDHSRTTVKEEIDG